MLILQSLTYIFTGLQMGKHPDESSGVGLKIFSYIVSPMHASCYILTDIEAKK